MSNLHADQWFGWFLAAAALIALGIWRIRKSGHAEGGEITPLDDLLEDDTTAAEADVYPTGHFTREGWTEFTPGYWVRDVPHEENECALHEIPGFDAQFAGEVLADIDDLATTEEEAQ